MIKFTLLYSPINNLSKTHVILSIPFAAVPGSFQCDFDTNICGWIQDRSDDFDWKRQSGQTGSSNTGPNTDHTTGSGLHEYTPQHGCPQCGSLGARPFHKSVPPFIPYHGTLSLV